MDSCITKSDSAFEFTLRRNQEATELMKVGDYEGALTLLHSAETYSSRTLGSQREQQLLRVIFNNLGCCYMKGKQLPLAAKYLIKALESEPSTDLEQVVGMRVNLSTVYYQLKDFNQSLVEALKSLHLLEAKLRSRREDRLYAKSLNCAGMAYEALMHRRKALLYYFRGISVASETLGVGHELTQTIKARYDNLCRIKDMLANSDSEGALLRLGNLTAARQTPVAAPLFTKVQGPRRRRKSLRGCKQIQDPIFITAALRSPNVLKVSSSTPKLKSRLRISPSHTQVSSTAASSKDLGIPRIVRTTMKSPESRLMRTRRLRTPSENHASSVNKSENSEMETRLHSIDEKLMTLTQRLSEYGWKNSEMRRIAEKASRLSSGLTTPMEESMDERTACAILIQKHVRGFLARRRLRNLRQKKQSFLRSHTQEVPVKKHKKVVLSCTKRTGRLARYSMYHAK